MTHDDAPQLGPNEPESPPIEFDEDDIELVVIPLRRVTRALGVALVNTIDYASPLPRAGASAEYVIDSWEALGDEVLRFMKAVDA